MRRKDRRGRGGDQQVVLLADLEPRKDVKGGAGKLLFGEHPEAPPVKAERRERSRERSARRGEP